MSACVTWLDLPSNVFNGRLIHPNYLDNIPLVMIRVFTPLRCNIVSRLSQCSQSAQFLFSWSLSEQLMAAMSVNASAQRSGSKAFFGLRQPPAIPNTQSKKPEVDTKNSPDFMQYKITCVQLDKNSANYLHWRDIQLKQWTGIWKRFSFLSTNYLPCHNFSLLFSEMQLIINYNYI